jgi:hypothetical protein
MQTTESSPDAGMYYTSEAYLALLEKYALLKGACHHCWHTHRVWQGPLPIPRLCCWCGQSEGPQHGPYAPKG